MKFIGAGLAVGLVLGGAGAAKVWWDMSSAVQSQTAAVQATQEQCAADTEALRTQAVHEASVQAMLSVRVGLSQAVEELDRSNFGTAKERLEEARTTLAQVKAETLGVDDQAFGTLVGLLTAADIIASTDLGPQRQKLQATARSVHDLLKTKKAPVIEAKEPAEEATKAEAPEAKEPAKKEH